MEDPNFKATDDAVLLAKSIAFADNYATSGAIADLSDLNGSPVYIVSGLLDEELPTRYQE